MDTKKGELGLDNWWYIFDAIAQAEDEGADRIAIGMINFYLTKDEAMNIEERGFGKTLGD